MTAFTFLANDLVIVFFSKSDTAQDVSAQSVRASVRVSPWIYDTDGCPLSSKSLLTCWAGLSVFFIEW